MRLWYVVETAVELNFKYFVWPKKLELEKESCKLHSSSSSSSFHD